MHDTSKPTAKQDLCERNKGLQWKSGGAAWGQLEKRLEITFYPHAWGLMIIGCMSLTSALSCRPYMNATSKGSVGRVVCAANGCEKTLRRHGLLMSPIFSSQVIAGHSVILKGTLAPA